MKTILKTLVAVLFTFTACNQNSDKKAAPDTSTSTTSDETEKETTGSFSVNGQKYNGKVEVQKFGAAGKENFSVLCQADGAASSFALLQVTFVTESEAKKNGSVDIYAGSMLPMTEPQPGVAAVTLSGTAPDIKDEEFSGTEKTKTKIQVTGSTFKIDDAKLYTREGKEIVVSAQFNY